MIPVFLRLLILLLAFFAAADATAAPRRSSIGCILTADTPHYQKMYADFVTMLAQKGYDRQKLEIFLQVPNPDQISWANAARKLKGLDVDVIVAFGGAAAHAAFREVRDVPLVYVDVYSPVETGLTRSMTMSGNHATGVSSKIPLITLFKAVAETRGIRTVGIVSSAREAGSSAQASDARRTAAQLGFSVRDLTILTSSDIDTNLPKILKGIDVLFLTEAVIVQKQLDRIVKKATESHVPVISVIQESAPKGALFSLVADQTMQSEQAVEMVIQILGGTPPGRIPIEHPRRVELTANLRAARALDITVPFSVLSIVTKVIK